MISIKTLNIFKERSLIKKWTKLGLWTLVTCSNLNLCVNLYTNVSLKVSQHFLFLIEEEGWAPKNWCFWTMVLEKTLESPLDCKEIQPVHSKGDQPWDFSGRNDAKAETPILWPPHAKSWLIGKDSDAGRDWGQEEKGRTEDEMAGWHHWLDGRESKWTPELVMDREAWRAVIHGVSKSRTRLSDWTELNWIRP